MNLAKVPQEAPFISPLPFCFFSNYSCAVSSSFFFLFAFIRQLLKSWLDRLMHSITLNNVSSCLMDPISESPNQLPPACCYTCRTVGVIVRTVETRLIFSPHFWWAVEKEKANWFRHPPNMCHQSKVQWVQDFNVSTGLGPSHFIISWTPKRPIFLNVTRNLNICQPQCFHAKEQKWCHHSTERPLCQDLAYSVTLLCFIYCSLLFSNRSLKKWMRGSH